MRPRMTGCPKDLRQRKFAMRSGVESSSCDARVSVQPGLGVRRLVVVPAVLGGFCGALLPASESLAACSPPTGSNITVTCLGAALNQGPAASTGYGDSTQNGLTINVQPAASVTGTNTGIAVNINNIINNFGTITTAGGDLYGISGN